MADSSDVDAAIVAKLLADAPLQALMPDGVYFGEAAPGATRFVVVAHIDHDDEYGFERATFWETFVYMVKAVALSTSGGDTKAAAARIHALLQNGTLAPANYRLMRLQRLGRFRYPEPDANVDRRWQHCGGNYEVKVIPLNGATTKGTNSTKG